MRRGIIAITRRLIVGALIATDKKMVFVEHEIGIKEMIEPVESELEAESIRVMINHRPIEKPQFSSRFLKRDLPNDNEVPATTPFFQYPCHSEQYPQWYRNDRCESHLVR